MEPRCLPRLAQTALADIVYTPHPVPARAAMRVPAPFVPAQCLLPPLFSTACAPAAMLVRMFALCVLVFCVCALRVPALCVLGRCVCAGVSARLVALVTKL